MPIEEKLKKYPICDTDIWIKLSKVKGNEYAFSLYNKLFFSDAVVFELQNKKKHCEEEFGCGIDQYNVEIKSERAYYLDLYDSNFFNSKERRAARRLFQDSNIEYDEELKCFKNCNHLGEKVSLIYASIHGLKILLSDDGDSKKYARTIRNRRFPMVSVVDIDKLLEKNNLSLEEITKIKEEANKSFEEKEAEKEVEDSLKVGQGVIKNLKGLKFGLRMKNKM